MAKTPESMPAHLQSGLILCIGLYGTAFLTLCAVLAAPVSPLTAVIAVAALGVSWISATLQLLDTFPRWAGGTFLLAVALSIFAFIGLFQALA